MLLSLPADIFLCLLSFLDLDDIWNLCQCQKDLWNYLLSERVSRDILQMKVRYSDEARTAVATGRGFASALRQVVNRRHAVVAGRPYIVAPIAFCDAFLYCNGILCYVMGERLRILDIHKSGKWECVVHIHQLLLAALPCLIAVEESQVLFHDHHRGRHVPFKVVYSFDNIVVCVFSLSPYLTALLEAFDSDSPILESTTWLIVFDTSSAQILTVHGSSDNIHFVRSDSNFLYYGIQKNNREWMLHAYEFGKAEWHTPFYLRGLYGVDIGSEICFEIFEGYFYALSNQTSPEVEEVDWTSFYTCFRFPLGNHDYVALQMTDPAIMWRKQHVDSCLDDRWTGMRLYVDEMTGKVRVAEFRKEIQVAASFLSGRGHGGSGRSRKCYLTDVTFPDLPETPRLLSRTSLPYYKYERGTLPDEPIVRLLRPDDHPHFFHPPPRHPQDVHKDKTLHLRHISQVPIRFYSTSAMAFIDVIHFYPDRQSLRIRIQSRQRHSPHAPLPSTPGDMYQEYIIEFPSAHDGGISADQAYAIDRIMNPPTHLGAVQGTADERGILYGTGSSEHGAPQVLVLITFDPAIKLHTSKFPGNVDSKNKGSSDAIPRTEGQRLDQRAPIAGGAYWMWREPPMYTDIGLDMYLGR